MQTSKIELCNFCKQLLKLTFIVLFSAIIIASYSYHTKIASYTNILYN